MAIYIDWGQKVIHVPRADMTLLQSVPTEIRQLNLDTLRLTLKDLEDDPAGMPFPRTHRHNTSVEVGGVILARVVEIINGYTVTFEDGQYAVNLVGANSNVGDVVNVNQVSVRSANSAGLQDLSTLLAAAYFGEVCIHPTKGQPGTDIPLGTRKNPSNNMVDAIAIAEANSIHTLRFLTHNTVTEADLSEGYSLVGDSAVVVMLTIEPGANVASCEFMDMTVQGTMDGMNIFRQCNILDVNYVNGFLFQCALNGTITLGGGQQCSIFDCYSNVAGGGDGQYATIDFSSGPNSLAMRGYDGGIMLKNFSGGAAVSIDMDAGRVIVDSSCTDGDIFIRGNALVTDNSTGQCTVHNQTTPNRDDLAAVWSDVLAIKKSAYNRRKWDRVGTLTLYEDDKTTPLAVFDTDSQMSEITPQ